MIEIGEINLGESVVEYTNNAMKLKINNGDFVRGGVLLTNNEIAWKNENTNDGFTIPWGKIVVTAISQEPQRCIYFMIDSQWTENDNKPAESNSNGNGANGDENNENEDDEGSETESENAITEFWLIPEDSGDVENLYFFMSKYPAAEGEMDDDSDGEFFDGENIEQMNINDDDDPRFADP